MLNNATQGDTNTKNILQFKKLQNDAIVPTRGTEHSAGWDLYALEDTNVSPLNKTATMVRTGIAVQLPPGTYGRIALRSGLSFREGAVVTAGVIDEDYTDEVKVLIIPKVNYHVLSNTTTVPPLKLSDIYLDLRGFTIKAGERFAQLIIEQIYTGPADTVSEFHRIYEKHSGFGSTGK